MIHLIHIKTIGLLRIYKRTKNEPGLKRYAAFTEPAGVFVENFSNLRKAVRFAEKQRKELSHENGPDNFGPLHDLACSTRPGV